MTQIGDWEENTERRLGILEGKVDKLLDPEKGIYPKLAGIEERLTKWALAILTSTVVTVVTVVVTRH